MVERVAKVFVRVDGSAVEMDFIVDMRSGGAAAAADVSDDVTAFDVLAGGDGESRHVTEERLDAVAVVDDDDAAVSVAHFSGNNDTVCRGMDGLAIVSTDID